MCNVCEKFSCVLRIISAMDYFVQLLGHQVDTISTLF